MLRDTRRERYEGTGSLLIFETVLLLLNEVLVGFLQLSFVPEAVVVRVELKLLLESVLLELGIDACEKLFGFFAFWIVMLVNDVANFSPFFDNLGPELISTVATKLFDLSFVR